MKGLRFLQAGLGLLLLSVTVSARGKKAFRILSGQPVTVDLPADARPVLATAAGVLEDDLQKVFGNARPQTTPAACVTVEIDPVKVRRVQGFRMEVLADGRLSVLGHDSHGAAYGLMELSRRIGVSPWEWWADAAPMPLKTFELPAGYVSEQAPSVEFRGIFINDEDWGLMPWSSLTYEPWHKKGRVGPKTNAKIFELLLRLRANYYWPAMHECTEPFFLTEGNRETAARYGIYIGGSHCEPMASSTAVEWGRRGTGSYDYVNNRDNVHRFWEERMREVAGQEIVYTLGMRGVHDGRMNGAKTVEEQKDVLTRVIADQRKLIAQYVCPDVERVPQVFIPYKEVLDIYNAGLSVPDDVTLMWCDDNYGYIRHFPTAQERTRRGGNGIYYHVSYWGRPHDHLWLGTFSPALLYQQMRLAYDKGIQRMWILNVGDIKPSEYQMELFLDMAWDMDAVTRQGVENHMGAFLKREFGDKVGRRLLPVMREHYRLAFVRKPEFMGNTREEEYDPKYRVVRDLPWSEACMRERLAAYGAISDKVEALYDEIPLMHKDTYYQLVKYPVQAAAEMNKKLIYAQLARHGKADWAQSDAAYDSIVALTRLYNDGVANGGKWRNIMDYRPRRLPVFNPVKPMQGDVPMVADHPACAQWNGCEAKGDYTVCEGLGHECGAIAIRKNVCVAFDCPAVKGDSLTVELNFLPTHPIEQDMLSVGVGFGNGEAMTRIDYATHGRSEEWKENVLNNRAVRRVTLPAPNRKRHKLCVTALTEGVILDQVKVYAQTKH